MNDTIGSGAGGTPQTPKGSESTKGPDSPNPPRGSDTPQTPEVSYRIAERVREALAVCGPALRADGGDIELVRITPDGIAEVRFTGECRTCSLSKMTLRAGVERVVMHYAPEIRRVESVQ